ncbi:50S ribosomal protein L9 [Anaerotignum sp. MSJ-24]|jgi:large subunit ribosomal protein L9|uniref:50S ribosomal protein L9 n=1 Tax=Anaerotignum sp. MSJ-24 TaxID=2841521 RepID=UPI001C0FDB6B|nr:50S ribosomal protein L9 [Anaerotignum sp. MSJ-24]MBD9219582.1 50S ribosomal protein L9 [Clostridiales bacterium]MBU5464124.1 50S ribosomal protein L9 [Anaerotignum sp. MSJ-24]
MKLILLEDVKSVGKKGDIVNKNDGYALNYLIPKKLAVEATKANMNDLELKKKAEEKRKKEELEEAKKIAEQLNDKVVKVSVKAGENGKVFGSVTNKEIADALAKQTGMDIDKKKISFDAPIKMVGRRIVKIKLHPQVTVELAVEIAGE